MCNCVIYSWPCQSNTESAGMPCLETLVTRPDASNRLSHVTWVTITLRSSVSKHLRFGISTPCWNVSFTSFIPSCQWIECSFIFNKPSPKAFQRIWQYIQPASQPPTTYNHTSPGPPHPASSPPRSSETSHPDSCCNNRFTQPKNVCTYCQKPSQGSSSACSSSSSGFRPDCSSSS